MDTVRKYQLFAAGSFFLVAGLNLFDLAFTYVLIARYGTRVELNPLVVAMWNGSPLYFVLYKVVISILTAGCGLLWRRFQKWCVVMAFPAALYTCVVGLSLYYMLTLHP